MTPDINANQLAEELAEASEENKKFLTEIDAKIKKADLKYAQMVVEEDKTYLKLAKKIIKKS
jgi:hypothetical protein